MPVSARLLAHRTCVRARRHSIREAAASTCPEAGASRRPPSSALRSTVRASSCSCRRPSRHARLVAPAPTSAPEAAGIRDSPASLGGGARKPCGAAPVESGAATHRSSGRRASRRAPDRVDLGGRQLWGVSLRRGLRRVRSRGLCARCDTRPRRHCRSRQLRLARRARRAGSMRGRIAVRDRGIAEERRRQPAVEASRGRARRGLHGLGLHELVTRRQIVRRRSERVAECRARLLQILVPVLEPFRHLAHGHLALGLVVVLLRLLEAIAHAAHAHEIRLEIQPRELAQIVARDLLHVAVVQRHLQILLVRRHPHHARVREDRLAALGVIEVVDRDLAHPIRRFVDVARAQEELPGHHLVDHLLAQRERRLLARDVRLQRAQPVIAAREHLVVEHEHEEPERAAEVDRRPHDAHHRDPARAQRRHLVLRREPAERVEHGHEHAHRHRHRNDEGDRE